MRVSLGLIAMASSNRRIKLLKAEEGLSDFLKATIWRSSRSYCPRPFR
jgi:hypothetical protein